jgi:hypothetical protein
MSRRPARFTQADIARAIRAAEDQHAKTGTLWRVRVEREGDIVIEPFDRQSPDPWGPPLGNKKRREIIF